MVSSLESKRLRFVPIFVGDESPFSGGCELNDPVIDPALRDDDGAIDRVSYKAFWIRLLECLERTRRDFRAHFILPIN